MRHFLWLVVFFLRQIVPAVGAEPAVRCLPLEDARQVMGDESHEPFFSVLQPREIAAMTGTVSTGSTPAERRDEVRRRFVDAVRAFTPEEDAALVEMTDHLRGLLETRYPLMAREPWRYVKFDSSLVGGFPHTRGPWIFLSDRVVERLVKNWKTIQNKKGSVAGLTTLVHEQMHVLERTYPERFKKLYVDEYGFRFGPVRDDPWIAARRISNPDALRWEWVFPVKREGKEEYYAPQMLLRDGPEVPRMGADFQFACVRVEPAGDGFRTVQKDGRPIVVQLAEVPEYLAAMPIRGGLDHPNELTAYLFEQVFIQDVAQEGATPLEKGVAAAERAVVGLKPEVEQVRTWFRANLR
jgi:hypothetical protein